VDVKAGRLKNLDWTTFTFRRPYFPPKQACGPEARALHAKSIGGESIPPEDPVGLPQNGAGRSAPGHAKRLTPLHQKNPGLGERTACPPDPRNEACLMVFACNALASGPGMV